MKTFNKLLFIVLLSTLCCIRINAQALNDDPKASEQNEDDQLDEDEDEVSGNDELIDSLKSLMDTYNTECRTISIEFAGYESGSNETLYYDSLGVVCGYHLTWDMEGTSGEEFYWFEQGQLVYVYKETLGQTDEPDIVFLNNYENPGEIQKYTQEIPNTEERIRQILIDYPDSVIENEYSVTISLEETKNYGFDFIEKTEISIDKSLYDQILKE
jgi:hypothetical protein